MELGLEDEEDDSADFGIELSSGEEEEEDQDNGDQEAYRYQS